MESELRQLPGERTSNGISSETFWTSGYMDARGCGVALNQTTIDQISHKNML